MIAPLRIAVLSVHTCPLAALGGKKTGGMNVYVRELSRELGRLGVRVDVFTRAQGLCAPHVSDGELAPNVRVIHLIAGPEEPLSTRQIYDHLPEFEAGVRHFAEEQGIAYDLIHSHYWLSGWVAERLRESWGIPFIQMFHTLGLMKNRIATSESELEPPLRTETEREIVQAADVLIAATPAERIQLMWLYHANMRKIRVIPPGVDLQHFCPIPRYIAKQVVGIAPHHRMLLYVGRIEPLKGIDTLLHGLTILKEQMGGDVNDLCLSIIGGTPEDADQEDEEMRRLRLLREQLGLGDLVTFLGARSQETLQYYYSAAEMVLMPSHYESFGMVALEAMACGTPVITSEVGGLAYLVRNGVTGFHVPTGSPDELAEKIKLLLDNPDLRDEMSLAAAAHAKAYDWGNIARQVERVYRDLVRRP